MKFIRLCLRLLSPFRLLKLLSLLEDKRNYQRNLCRVTRLESAQDLHDKIRNIDRKVKELYFPAAE